MLKKQYGQHLLKNIPGKLFKDFSNFFNVDFLTANASNVNNANNVDVVFDLVIEIGPGRGALTKQIVKLMNRNKEQFAGKVNMYFQRLLLLEIDSDMVSFLQNSFELADWIELLEQDAVQFDYKKYIKNAVDDVFKDAGKGGVKDKQILLRVYFVGALPYNVSKPIILKTFSDSKELVQENVDKNWQIGYTYIVQAEVADLFAKGVPDASLLYNVAKFCGFSVRKVCNLAPKWFIPPPRVSSACMVGRYLTDENREVVDSNVSGLTCAQFTDILGIFYRYQRKTLRKILLINKKAGLDQQVFEKVMRFLSDQNIEKLRPREVEFEKWVLLSKLF